MCLNKHWISRSIEISRVPLNLGIYLSNSQCNFEKRISKNEEQINDNHNEFQRNRRYTRTSCEMFIPSVAITRGSFDNRRSGYVSSHSCPFIFRSSSLYIHALRGPFGSAWASAYTRAYRRERAIKPSVSAANGIH